ncbi:hypothetical protein ACWDTT_05070 [Streptosporangium sandarakinum]|uniref:hypothetical protein n=1 Tax=Streptosporangium TaxID=2000 RepID=UPI0031F8E605
MASAEPFSEFDESGEPASAFYSPGVPLDRLRPRPAAAAPSDLLLRMLEPPAVRVRHIPLIDLLRKPYRELGSPDR